MNPYQPPTGPGAPGASALPPDERAKLREAARAQRYINLVILGYGAVAAFSSVIEQIPGGRYLFALFVLAVVVAGAIFAVQMARALYSTAVAVLCAFLLFVPCVGLLTLLVLNNRATARLGAAGLKVGLLGAEPAEVARVLGS